MARSSHATWEMLNVALRHLHDHINGKTTRYSLSIVDLLHVSNFKGGNASITEPKEALEAKLQVYSEHLEKIARQFSQRRLVDLSGVDLRKLQNSADEFLSLTGDTRTSIRGLGPSYVSALLHAYFPDVFPVLDRRVLNGAGIAVSYGSRGQVKRIKTHYPALIAAFYAELRRESSTSLRELDKRWFVIPLPERDARDGA